MKQIFALILTLVMLLALAACGGDTAGNPTSPNTGAATNNTTQTNPPETTATPTTNPIPTTTVHNHTWSDATCTSPKTCSTCGVTEGDALGHNWNDATCTAPKTCSACKATEGSANGHSWTAATCTAPKTCSACKATEGSANSHNWSDATCTTPKTCKTCNATEGSANGHNWSEATCTTPKTCKTCNATEGSANGHNWADATCTSAKTCSSCSKTEGNALGHSWSAATCSSAKNCSVCNKTEGSALGHDWTEATCTSPTTCSRCQTTTGAALGHSYTATITTATCTTQGFTTYVCHCGDTYVADYINPTHNYQNYVCRNCGAADRAHAYEYLVEWVKHCGKVNGEHVEVTEWIDDSMCTIAYNSTGNYLYVSVLDENGYILIDLSATDRNFSYFCLYGHEVRECESRGKIDGSTYSTNSPISCDAYYGSSSQRAWFMETTRLYVNLALLFLDSFLDQSVRPSIDITDLGFANF